jgi:1-acyl-sn-glycerol-3-phosphate acyltransferase
MAKLWLFLFNMKVRLDGKVIDSAKPQLILSNHLSYLDVPIILACYPSLFVTSVEVRETPVLGFFCALSQCIFVERRKKSQLPEEIAKLKQVFAQGFRLGLFPEGTSSNGSSVLAFRKSLLAAADQEISILPLCINYRSIDGVPISQKNRDTVCWYGTMDFLPHFIKLLQTKEICVDLMHAEMLQTEPGVDRKQIADQAYAAITNLHLCTT